MATPGPYYTIEDIRGLFSKPSFSSLFMVHMPIGESPTGLSGAFSDADLYNTNRNGYRLEERVSLLCTDATLPGSTFNTVEVKGHRQGIIERYANYRIYPNIDFSFLVDQDHTNIRLFETWMNYINPLEGDQNDTNSYFKMEYPDDYVLDFFITKFEKNDNHFNNELDLESSRKTVYKFLRGYPTNIASMPVSYEGTSLIKATITFQYDRYTVTSFEPGDYPDFLEEFDDPRISLPL